MEASSVFGNKIRKKKKKNLSFNRLFCQVALEKKKKERKQNTPMLREPATFQDCERVSGVADVALGEPLQTSGVCCQQVRKAKPPKLLTNPTTSLNADKEHRGGLSV